MTCIVSLAISACLLSGCNRNPMEAGNPTFEQPIERQQPALSPPPSAGHALVYHDSLRAILLLNSGLGGMSSPPSTARTKIWKWDGSAWSVIDSAGPPIRNLGGVAYDAVRNRVVVFGGSYSQDLVYGDTWEWSSTGGWTRRDVPGPGRRDHGQLAFDLERKRSVLFGGQVTVDSFPTDTWTWDGQAWQRMEARGPRGRVHFGMTYDPVGRRVLVFGGVAPPGESGETWAWNGTGWSEVATPIAPRTHSQLGPSADGVLLVGGFGAQSNLVFKEAGWAALNGPGPSPRYLTAMAYDHRRRVTVLFGGGDPSSDQLLADTWEYSPSTGWTKKR